ncbi:MAG TPA: DUF3822 family protein [Chitinophagaceae bacterium]|nr:DUF3822 family protein [Chitinophagaceae bacterium]
MDKLFQIDKENKGSENEILLCELGDNFTCIANYNEVSKQIDGLTYYTFPPQQMTESIKQIISSIEGLSIKKVVCSSFADAVLVPYSLYKEETKHTFFIDAQYSNVLQDRIAEWQIVNTYTLPNSIYQLFEENETVYFHSYTPTLKIYNGFVAENQVSINFTPQQFSVLIKKEGQLQLAQTYSYTVPLDVVYYLLSIYERFNLSKTETYVLLSGLIEEDSALYKELNNYFLNLHFNASAAGSIQNNNYPPHYFTSLFNLAACVL